MDELAVSTVVYLPPQDVYDFLVDFPRYADYSDHLTEVERHGDGSPGTRYVLRLAWWKLTYAVHSEVTGVSPPTRIDWRVVRNLDAEGCWRIEEIELPADAPADATAASRVTLEVAYDPHSAKAGALELPRFVSLGWVVDRLEPVVRSEAERVVERIVADVEGRRRPVDVEVTHGSTDGA